MSVDCGPAVPKGGLILSYDISNTEKSWQGALTTNLIDVSEDLLNANWTKEAWAGTITANYGLAPNGTNTSTRIQYTAGYFYRLTTTTPAITALTAGTTVTFSCWVKGVPQPGRGIGLWSYAVGGIVTASTQSINSSSWTRVSLTYTIAAGATSFAIMLSGAPGNIFQGDIEVWRPQLEVQSFATPFVNGTRTSTQVVVDQTGNNTLTATGLVYEKIPLTPSYSGPEKDFLTADLAQYGITVDEVAEQIWSNDGNAKVLTITKRITFFTGAIYYQAYAATVTLAANGTKWQPGSWVGAVRGLTLTKLESTSTDAFTFNGSSSNFLLNDINLGNGNLPWTVSAWIKTTTAVNGTGFGAVISNWNSGPVYSSMGVNAGKIVYWTYQNAAWTQKLGVGKTVNDNSWHLLTWVNYNNFTMDMYVDGVLDSNVPNSTSGNNNPVNSIGRSWAGFFAGNIAAVSIYNRSLSATEVAQNFNATRNRYGI